MIAFLNIESDTGKGVSMTYLSTAQCNALHFKITSLQYCKKAVIGTEMEIRPQQLYSNAEAVE